MAAVELTNRQQVELARLSPVGWGLYTDPAYRAFRWIRLLNRYLVALAARRLPTNRLAVFVPPQHGKSTTISRVFPPWYLGNFPRHKVILASYAFNLAEDHGLEAMRSMERYGPEVFGVAVDPRRKSAGRWSLLRHGGGMRSVGIGGGTTGRPAHAFIIDDPHADHRDAMGKAHQENAWNWHQGVAQSRLQEDAVEILLMTRWHDLDLGGRILTQAAEVGEPWIVLRLPALAEEDEELGHEVQLPGELEVPWIRKAGEPLEPRRFSRRHLERVQKTRVPRYWLAQYQQRPRPETGDKFKREWFRYYTTIGTEWGQTFVLEQVDPDTLQTIRSKRVVRSALKVFTTVDLALTEDERNDYTVAATWGMVPSTRDLLLLDLVRARLESPDIIPMLQAVRHRTGTPRIHVESTAFQASVVQYGKRTGLPVVRWPAKGEPAKGDKDTRATFAAARMEGGAIWFPAGTVPWDQEAYEAELVTFPTGEHDDQVDVTSMAADVVEGGPDRTLRGA